MKERLDLAQLKVKSYASIEAPAGPAWMCGESPTATAGIPVLVPSAVGPQPREIYLDKEKRIA